MNQRIQGILLGIVLTIIIVSAVGIVIAHSQNAVANTGNKPETAEYDCMQCIGLSLDEMDEDNDGLCDYCGMSVELCAEMFSGHEDSGHKHGMCHQIAGSHCH